MRTHEDHLRDVLAEDPSFANDLAEARAELQAEMTEERASAVDEATVELVAEALHVPGPYGDMPWDEMHQSTRGIERREARAAIDAYRATLGPLGRAATSALIEAALRFQVDRLLRDRQMLQDRWEWVEEPVIRNEAWYESNFPGIADLAALARAGGVAAAGEEGR